MTNTWRKVVFWVGAGVVWNACVIKDEIARTWDGPGGSNVGGAAGSSGAGGSGGRADGTGGSSGSSGLPGTGGSGGNADGTGGSLGSSGLPGTGGNGGGGGGLPGPVSWSSISSMNEARLEHTMTKLQDGRVLVTGGYGPGSLTNALDSVEIWDPGTQSFTLAKPMHTRRARHAATLRSNGKVFVTGGHDSILETAKAEEYDPATDTWTELSMMTVGRMYHASVELPNGNILVASGCCDAAYQTAEVYDVTLGKFTATSPPVIAHAAPTLTLMPNGQALLVGNSVLKPTSLYEDSLQQWTSAGNLDAPRNAHTATMLSTGHVVVAGGLSMGPPTNTVESYDPSQKQWTQLAPLVEARRSHTASHLVANALDDILWIGGLQAGGTPLASCERLSGQPCANLNVARGLHQAVVVDVNGQTRILVTGGQGTDNQPTNSAEL